MAVGGRLVFCEICKAMRFASCVVADVTTLNFNLLFEIGYGMGLGIPVIPVRDSTYSPDEKAFSEIGILDTVGYLDFSNSEQLANLISDSLPGRPIPQPSTAINRESPLYVLKGPIDTDGSMKLMSTLKKSNLRFRTYDPFEKPRLSLHEARRQVSASLGLVAHLLSPARRGSQAHNGLCALIAGIAMAEQKIVVMLQEEQVVQPIDYRDIVQAYVNTEQIPTILERPIVSIVKRLQGGTEPAHQLPTRTLEKLDLGDVAAENEIRGLRSYFVRTGQYNQAKRGHSRLIVGRKGTGKTAIFYAIRDSLSGNKAVLSLDLKPEGHQFTKLREAVLNHLSPGLQEHTLTAFWNYILLAELAHKVVEDEYSYAQRDSDRWKRYTRLKAAYEAHDLASEDDLSLRLLRQVDRLTEEFGRIEDLANKGHITELLYRGDIRELDEAVCTYLKEKDAVWLLIDNLDKGWPTRRSTDADILILRALLEAARKLQHQLEARDVDLNSLVFIRTDIYEHLLVETSDKGKDTAIRLDWDDPAVFREILRQRIRVSSGSDHSFYELWQNLFVSHIGTEDSFNYMVDRTLMRPRDLLNFVQRAIEVALNRGNDKVTIEDIIQAEHSYSQDIFLATAFEIEDTHPNFADALYAFQGCSKLLSKEDVEDILGKGDVPREAMGKAIELLLWFGFIGVTLNETSEAKYSYQVRYNLRQLLAPINRNEGIFSIHPCFQAALGVPGVLTDKYA